MARVAVFHTLVPVRSKEKLHPFLQKHAAKQVQFLKAKSAMS